MNERTMDRPETRLDPGPPTPDPGNRRGRETRARIFAAAASLLADRGYDFTLEDVAEGAGTSRMTVYRHVGSREDLLTSLLLRASADLVGEVRAVLEADRPFADRLVDATVLVVERVREAPHLTAVVTSANPSEEWPRIDPEGRFVHVVWEFFRPYIEGARQEVTLRAEVDETIDWLLRQILALLTIESRMGSGPEELRHQLHTFLVPSIVEDSA